MLILVNFTGRTNLSTVGYALYNPDGTLHTARATDGVTERPAGSGTYGADATIPYGFTGELRWDTGEVVPARVSTVLDGGGELTVESISGALTTIARVKALPGIGAYTDDQIAIAINTATLAIEHYCNRTFASTVYTAEKYDGNGMDTLYLKQYPITAVSAITVNDSALTTDDYEVDTQSLYKSSGWVQGRRNIAVTYTAGYSTMPEDLVMAATRIVGDMLSDEPINPNIKSEKVGDYQYTLGDVSSNATMAVQKHSGELAPYRKWTL